MLNTKNHKSLVLFDLDGVLLNSRHNMERAWRAVQGEMGVTMPFESYFAEIGRPFADIMARLGLAERAAGIEAIYKRTSEASLRETPFYDGVDTMLETLSRSGMKLGIVTSKDRDRTGLILSRLTAAFHTVQTPNGTNRGKPAPDHLLMAMAECNVDPAESIYVGDMDSDAEAAFRAGIDYAHARWGYGGLPEQFTVAVSDCRELTAYLLGPKEASQ